MIAVLSVVLYHFGLPGLPGGFIGVDVFFVISGFLIGGILWRDLTTTGTLSLARFYTRRVKRLAPAYFAMTALTALAAWAILLPFEFREFGKELIAATLYLSNIHFWRGEGYFDIGAENKVLLHTWSLAVEEQFYIVLPFVILLFKRSRRALLFALSLAFATSLIACLALTPTDQTSTFYLFPFRAWELLTGVLLAIWGIERHARWSYHPALSWAGLGLILAGASLISAQGFPGWQAFVPALGTALLLANGRHHNPVNDGLSTAPVIFIGKISYSLYLWHWPVLVLSRYWRDGYSGGLEAALWLAFAFVLATLSWAYIETPFRRMQPKNGWRVLAALALPSAIMLGLGALAYVKDGLPSRFGPEARIHIQAAADFNQDWSRCHTPTSGPFEGVELCPIGPEGPPRVVIWGDSHLRALKEGLEQAAYTAQIPALILWHAGCPPLFGLTKSESYATPAQDAACVRDTARIRDGLKTLPQAHTLFLVARWAYYASGHGIGAGADNTIQLKGYDAPTNAEALSRALNASLPEMAQQFSRIFVFRQPPEFPDYDSREMARLLAHHRIEHPGERTTIARDTALTRDTRPLFTPYTTSGQITLIDPWPEICTNDTCSVIPPDAPSAQGWYFDSNHLTNTAARALAPLFAPLFEAPQ
ncbi:acyltransferase [Rhodobacteraceae bacterium 10Alg 79]|uniref:Acyltransferase n=2 Tax=Rhodalgimonas zhirmunskyi TaxID=2964767 RepID=A0AAJ1UBH3_9RHOB|nr:acyltransferase [Rhodoalgimonas zhirmunskyi]